MAQPSPDIVPDGASERIRVDKWLWAARFFKTRSLAADAVESGKVLCNGARIKPARALKLGDELEVRTPGALYTILVRALSDRRGPAARAVQLYDETEQSKQARVAARLENVAHPDAYQRGRPTKRARRVLHKLRGEPL